VLNFEAIATLQLSQSDFWNLSKVRKQQGLSLMSFLIIIIIIIKNTQPHYSYTPESCLENDSHKFLIEQF
jgi:hypothetical protein